MRSKEVADLAGVTPRALRHYHQMGILPEPPRRANGYREYGAADVARVLRIKRLASLGFSLEQIRGMLGEMDCRRSDPEASGETVCVETLLDELDAELAARIDELEARRGAIAKLKKEMPSGLALLDVSPQIGAHIARLVEYGASARMAGMELDLMLLVDEHEAGADAMDDVLEFYALMEERGLMSRYIELSEEILALPPDATEDVCDALADRVVELIAPVLFGFAGIAHDEGPEGGEAKDSFAALERLLFDYDGEVLNAAQRRIELTALSRIRTVVNGGFIRYGSLDYDATS